MRRYRVRDDDAVVVRVERHDAGRRVGTEGEHIGVEG